jgi:hypothetical protein
MSGNLARRQTKFMPADFKLIEGRQPPLKDQYDEWARSHHLDRIDGVSAPAPPCGGGHSRSEGQAFSRTPYGWGGRADRRDYRMRHRWLVA